MPDQPTNLSDAPADKSVDPLSKLHKMSTTAGLGSGDYVAVNIFAVVTVLLGIASVLAKLNTALLAIPVAGIVCGFIAFGQIKKSGGTQTGRGVAIFGLILSIGIAGWVIAQQVIDYARAQSDQAAIIALVDSFGEAVKSDDYAKAYSLCDEDFHQLVNFEQFKGQIGILKTPQAVQFYGNITSIVWNGRLEFDVDNQTGTPIAIGIMLINSEKRDALREATRFRKIGSKWKIDSLPDMFQPPKPKAGQ